MSSPTRQTKGTIRRNNHQHNCSPSLNTGNKGMSRPNDPVNLPTFLDRAITFETKNNFAKRRYLDLTYLVIDKEHILKLLSIQGHLFKDDCVGGAVQWGGACCPKHIIPLTTPTRQPGTVLTCNSWYSCSLSSNKAYFEIIQFSTFKLSSKTAIIVIQYVTMLQQNTDFQI